MDTTTKGKAYAEALDETAEETGDETGANILETGEAIPPRGPEATIERVPEPDEDEAEEDDDVAKTETAENAAEKTADWVEKAANGPLEIKAIVTRKGWYQDSDDLAVPEPPALSTGDEYVAYLCGYRAGEDDPGWLLMLAEVGRHLGSFLTPEEEEVFLRLAAEEWWGRWALGYSDAALKRAKRALARPTEAMDW